jgi:5-methylcytosine-specific restriction protein A
MAWGQGSSRASRALRAQVLAEEPICRCTGCPRCNNGCTRPTTDDDHIVARSQGGAEDRANHRGLCHPCHAHKSAQEAARGRGKAPRARRDPEPHPGLR